MSDVIKSKTRSGLIYLELKEKHKKSGDFYEMVLMLRQDIPHQDALAFFQKIVGTIEGMSGKMHKTEYWGLRALRYKVKKNKQAHYYNLQYSGNGAIKLELDRIVRVSDSAIRHIILRIRELDSQPTIMVSRADDVIERGRVIYDEKYEPSVNEKRVGALQDIDKGE